MNSRGTLISHRIAGDTLATSDTVAMTPTIHPAAAGTQRYRECDRPRGPERDPDRDEASVTDREDMPSVREKLDEALRAAGKIRPVAHACRCARDEAPEAKYEKASRGC
ncbi:hypothetical protein MSEO_11290 [Mycobacterium seoulense]|uniref:Uncharacterized protein n=1 Tax=Mycobacterium seoulense TaxID=386911 RepID=A0A7I7NWK0_9MYCO|nr:hypothetical protein MSEO_11290 [Mycobacterium seoulense]